MKTTNLFFQRSARRMLALLAVAVFCETSALAASTNDLTSLLQRGLFEEEANRNLAAAIENYQSLVRQFDTDREIAATAVFRLGECYRKLGQTNEAVGQYQRIVREFPDQPTLVTLSRQNLAGLGTAVSRPPSGDSSLANLETRYQLLQLQLEQTGGKGEIDPDAIARIFDDERLKQALRERGEKVSLRMREFGTNSSLEKINAQMETFKAASSNVDLALDTLMKQKHQELRDLRAAIDHIDQGRGAQSEPTGAAQLESIDEEEQEIHRYQEMIQNSPDRINAAGVSGTPLYRAAFIGLLRVAKFLLDQGAEIDAKYNGQTPLQGAVQYEQKDMTEFLLSRGADINARDATGGTALHLVANNGFRSVAEILLNHQPEVNARNNAINNARTPLHLAAQNGLGEIMKLLIAHGADVNATSASGSTPLADAARNDKTKSILVLLAAKADPDLADNNGRTPLSYAAGREAIEALLAGKADPNSSTRNAPLLCAIRRQDVAAAELLLKSGADPNVNGTVDWAEGTRSLNNGLGSTTPLFLALATKQPAMVSLLLKFKADPNDMQTDGRPLTFAALSNTNILETLLAAGAKVDAHDKTSHINNTFVNWTPLAAAAFAGDAAAVKILLEHGADPNARDASGSTPLHYAASWLKDRLAPGRVFELLLEHRADPNVRNDDGATPLNSVKAFKNSNDKTAAAGIAELLRRHGALDNLPNWDRIAVRRPSAGFSATIFRKGTNDWNQFTLLETILNFYKSSQSYPVDRGDNTWTSYSANSIMPFPDLTRVTILRPSHNSTNETRIAVNLLNSTNGIDCSKDVPLEFGDMVEIPEHNHALGDGVVGLTGSEESALFNYLSATVQLVVHDHKTQLSFYPIEDRATLGAILSRLEARKILLSSSDLSRVKVSRLDPKTGRKREWILDCNPPQSTSYQFFVPGPSPDRNNPPPVPDLRLRNGDVIEVPDKP